MQRARALIVVLVLAAFSAVAVPPAEATAPAPYGRGLVIKVWHPPVTPTAIVGSGLGAVRTFYAPITVNGVSAPAGTQYMTGTLTTVAVDPVAGTELRTSNLAFVIGGLPNQLVVGGVLEYATTAATLSTGDTVTRPVLGGAGRFEDATGYVVSTNLGTGGWYHVFHIRP